MELRARSLSVALLSAALMVLATAAQDSALRRLTPAEIAKLGDSGPGAGSSGVAGIRTVVLHGDPTKPGLYTISLSVPARTRIEAHSHRDDRSATVVSGSWYLGYGSTFDAKELKALPAGSSYTEPPAQMHFAQTRDERVVVYITGVGPTDTTYSRRGSAGGSLDKHALQ